jgi:thiol-disulfide isomerase/thioredoxin
MISLRAVLSLLCILCILVASPRIGATPSSTESRASARAPVLVADGRAILEAVRQANAAVVLVNVWATWCIPCREEFPELLRLHEHYEKQGLKVILVSGDFPSELSRVKQFLAEQRVDFVSYLKAGDDMEFIDSFDPKWSGALPASFVYDGDGVRRYSFLGRVSYEQLEPKIVELLARSRRSAAGEQTGGSEQ